MEIVNPQKYQTLVEQAQAAAFSGWDFSWLEGRMIQDDPPWDYASLVRSHLEDTHSLLDIGTGGGEFLTSMAPLPPDTHATESFPPNQPIAKARLSPLGVIVHFTEDDAPLPFEHNRFDLVINRHEGFSPGEIFRILKPGGKFITQQVGGLDNLELNQVLEETLTFPYLSWSLESALTGLVEAGFTIEHAQKAALKTRFMDIGAVLYYLKAIPWQVPGFNLETQAQALIRLHNYIEWQGEFISTAHRFLLIAQKKEPTP